jgi:hypothetical protein
MTTIDHDTRKEWRAICEDAINNHGFVTQLAWYHTHVLALLDLIDMLEAERPLLLAVVEAAEEFLNDFCNKDKCAPGALRRPLQAYRASRGRG